MKLFDLYPLFDIEPVSGKGCYVYDQSGQTYLDFYTGHAVISIGHSHPHYQQRLQAQLQKIGFYSNSVQNSLQKAVAEKLGELSGCEDYQLFFCNSGAEAVENAFKFASMHTGKHKIISFERAFHGRTTAAINATDMARFKPSINCQLPVEFHAWNQTESVVKSLTNGDVCAVIVEGIQGIGGIHPAAPAFLQSLAQLCQTFEVPLILDEIQSGFGRSGHFFAFQASGIQPDIITVAKGMGNGFPVGGVLIHDKYPPQKGMSGSTFGGNHLACSAVMAVLEVIEQEGLIENSQNIGLLLKSELENIPEIKIVRGHGLMLGLEFDFPIAALRKQLLFEQQVFTGSSSQPNVMRILPPLSIGEKEVKLFIKKLKSALCQLPTPYSPVLIPA